MASLFINWNFILTIQLKDKLFHKCYKHIVYILFNYFQTVFFHIFWFPSLCGCICFNCAVFSRRGWEIWLKSIGQIEKCFTSQSKLYGNWFNNETNMVAFCVVVGATWNHKDTHLAVCLHCFARARSFISTHMRCESILMQLFKLFQSNFVSSNWCSHHTSINICVHAHTCTHFNLWHLWCCKTKISLHLNKST